MKHFYQQGLFKPLKTIFLILIIAFTSNAYGQLTLSGQQTVCEHESEIYTLQGAVQGIVYSWSITPSIGSINLISNNQAIIQWNTEDTCTISVSGGGQISNSLTVIVRKTIKPTITFTNQVGCQKISKEDTMSKNEIITDPNTCVNVCEYSEVEYTAHGTLLYGQNMSQFTWTVTGGMIIGVDGVTLSPPNTTAVSGNLFVPNGSYSRIAVKWDSVGTGTITVSELTPYGASYPNPNNCGPKTTTICVDIIEKPQADFLVDNQHFTIDDCYQICLNQTVSFLDISKASGGSPIIFYKWDFGDSSAVSHQPSPQHTYTKAGNYDVSLTVTNQCNCTDEYSIQICVDDRPAPDIACPSVVCENDKTKYTLDANCNNYKWLISGGTKLSQNDPEIEIKWDKVDSTGFGYLSIDGSQCDNICPALSTIRVPVILQNGTIKGPKTVCQNQIYRYELPAWPATNFLWSFVNNSNGATFSSLELRDNFIEIQTGSSSGTFELKGVYYNTITKSHCAGYANIIVNVLKKPLIETKEKSCIGLPLQCKLMEDSITLYSQSGQSIWTVLRPDMSSLSYTSSSNPFTIPDSVFNMAGKYRIFASSMGGVYCDPEFASITIVEKPPKPQTLEGEDHICVHFPYFYSTNIVDNTLMHWHLTGATDTGFVAHNGSITWNTYGTKNMILYREWEDLPGCVSDTFIKQIHNVNLSGSIVGNDSTYEDMVGTYTMALNGAIGDAYEWSVSSPATAGNISGGQGSSSCTITWLHQASPTWATIYCKVTKCGTKITFTKNVFIDKSAEITSFTATPNPVCSGVPISFVVHASGAPVSDYYFDFGDGFSSVHTPSNPNNQDTITHIYSNMGNGTLIYAVKVKVRSSNNGLITSTANVSVTVNPQPNSYLSPANPTSVPPDTLPMILNISTTNAGTNTFQWYYIEAGTFNLTTLSSTSNTYTISTNPPYNGDYWCVVTNNYGCATRTNHKILNDGANSQGGGCFPLAPAGIDSMPLNIVSTMPCGQAQVGCSVLGDTSNIITWNWGVSPSGTPYTTSGSGTINQSPVFTFEKAGMYQIVVAVQYKNAVAGNPPCTKSKGAYVIVPMVADFIWGFGCLGPNYNSYQLLLYDYSSLYPGYATQTRKWDILDSNMSLLTTIYANNTQDTLFTVPSNLLGKPIFVKLSITNNQQSGVVCTKLHSIYIPNLPHADFSVHTTYTGNPANPYKTCEGREVAFLNNSSPMSDIHTHIWSFDNNDTSYMVNTFEVYNVLSTPSYIYNGLLTITDKYGCKDDTSVQIKVFDNTLHATTSFPNPQYNPAHILVCPNDSFANPVFPLFGGGSGTIKYQWYKDNDTLYNVITQSLNRAYAGSGGYWVQISDANNCYLNLNPTPVLVTVKSAPTAIISGKEDICGNEKAELWVKTGMAASAPLSYLWSPNGYTTKNIIPTLYVGANPYTVTVSDNVSGCNAVSTPFTVSKHSLPSSPNISGPTKINCANYELGLSVTSPIAGYTYTWSTGIGGVSTSIYNGGAYRLWVRDTMGCKNHNDIAIPYPADYYFWRFPTGCYSFCPDELPKRIWPSTWVYGNQTQLFYSWAWKHDANLVSDITNGPQAFTLCNLGSSFGVGDTNSIPCRLFLGLPNPQPFVGGEGAGDYYWMLDNHICKSESDILNLSINECCKLDLRIEEIRCISASPSGNKYHFVLTVDGVPCPTQYNLSGINNYIPFSLPNAITINSLSSAALNPGLNQLSGTFTSQPNDSVVQFFINILCEDCYGESTIEILPKCPNSNRMAKNDTSVSISISDLTSLEVFPNPANQQIEVRYSFAENKAAVKPSYILNIHDNMGVIKKSRNLANSKGVEKLNIANLPSGIYYVVLIQDNARVKARKFVINH